MSAIVFTEGPWQLALFLLGEVLPREDQAIFQAVVALLILATCLCLHLRTQPYAYRLQNQIEKDIKLTSRWNRRIKAAADLALGVGPIPSEGPTERVGEAAARRSSAPVSARVTGGGRT